jgi:hypothetical protein
MFNERCFFVSVKGGFVSYVDNNGQTFDLPVPAGRVSCRDFVIEGFTPTVKGVSIIWPPSGVGIVMSPSLEETGANPDFSPTSAAWQQKKLAQQIQAATADAVAKAVASLVPNTAQEPDPAAPLVENIDPVPDAVAQVS